MGKDRPLPKAISASEALMLPLGAVRRPSKTHGDWDLHYRLEQQAMRAALREQCEHLTISLAGGL